MKTSKVLSIFLSALLCFCAFCTFSVSAEKSEYSGATTFIFSDSSVTVSKGDYSGYKISGTALTINGSGIYTVSGSCSDGYIKIKAGTTGVILVLDGITLTSQTTAPVQCNKSTEVEIVATDGTVNTFTDNKANNDELYPENENAENAVIKCKDGSKVTFSGSGIINVNSNGKNAIKSGCTTEEEGEAYLVIQDVTLNINATVNDAINAEQLLDIVSGTLNISAADDALHCDLVMNIGVLKKEGPTINISTCYEGIEAAVVNINSGNIVMHSTDDCINAANPDLSNYNFEMNINGGNLVCDTSSGDGFDSNGTMTFNGGTTIVWTQNTADNQPLDADGTITVKGGTVFAAGGSSGMGMNLNAYQGYVVYGSNSSMGGGGTRPGGGFMSPGSRPGGGGQTSGGGINISKGSVINIKNSSGTVEFSTTAIYNARYIFYSARNIVSGSSYTLYNGSTSVTGVNAQGVTASQEEEEEEPEPEVTTKRGDVNLDGRVTSLDLLKLKK